MWRHRRGLTQLDLAIQADVSARHVSFVETGRTIPSSAMVLHLAEHLAIPLRERNHLLVAAGHAPIFRQRPLEDPDLAGARDILEQIVRGHEPYPALVVDRRWNLVLANRSLGVFLDGVDEALLTPPVNMMRLGLHPEGFAPRLLNLQQVRGFLLTRLARQVAQTGDPELSALHEELLSYGPAGELSPLDPADLALPIRIRHRGVELCFVNTITTFGAAFDITLNEIAVEAYFPANPQTAHHLQTHPSQTPNNPTPPITETTNHTTKATTPQKAPPGGEPRPEVSPGPW